jgi:hypothetical protein
MGSDVPSVALDAEGFCKGIAIQTLGEAVDSVKEPDSMMNGTRHRADHCPIGSLIVQVDWNNCWATLRDVISMKGER